MHDLLVHDATVVTVDDRNRIIERGTITVDDGELTAVRPSREGDPELPAETVIDGSGTVAMPGLVNAHTHLEMTPLVGAFSDLDLLEMMGSMTAIFGRLGEGEYDYLAEAGYELAALNFLLGGVTTVNSMDVRPSAGAATFGDAGRADRRRDRPLERSPRGPGRWTAPVGGRE